ncbi:MAG: rhomboid family intramembrane serine protease [Bacteroidetes bacterium]|nr:rhomboid family intramembrane serine protease [Bacteroidota bacterium]MBS1932019.1 rhomboid family intramembrane serine protease [Bacteroidota bacterium]
MNYSAKKYKQRVSLGQNGNSLVFLIGINLVVFVIFAFIKALFYLNHGNPEGLVLYRQNVLPWIALSPDTSRILAHPWTIFTYMFVHDSVWNVFANMLWLWAFGYIMQDLTGNKKIVPVFIYSALAGALAFVLANNLLPALQPGIHQNIMFGASAGIMGVAIATTLVAPGFRIFPMLNGGVPLWILTGIYVVIDLATIPVGNTELYITHIAGALMGFLFIFLLRKGYDWSDWMNNFFDWVNNLFNPDKPKKGKTTKEELFYKSTSDPYKKTPHITQQRIDEILDKINQKGYNFLTKEEKELLKRASKENT